MSFEKLNEHDERVFHKRSCLILYAMSAQEIKQIQNAARLSGIRDFVVITPKQAETTVYAALDNEIIEGKEGCREKTLIFNHISSVRMNAFIEALKKCRIKRPLMAVVTETSINWSIQELVSHLMEERRAVSEGQFRVH